MLARYTDSVLDADNCYRALTTKDTRFDGVFFVGVKTTGIYCRPVCTARTPRRDRCTFYRSAAEAEKAGFRACFRCRPELAPGSAPVDAVPRLVAKAIEMIGEGYLAENNIESLARALEVTPRHLRRAMEDVAGVSPIELAQTRRLALSKQLLHDTDMTLTDIAFASGFGSVRRFNALFRERFKTAPSSLRKHSRESEEHGAITIRLGFREPFAWEAMLAFLGHRAIPGVESVDHGIYRRTVRFGTHRGTIAVRRDPVKPILIAEVSRSLLGVLMKLIARLRVLFDLDADPQAIGAHLSTDPLLAPLVARTPGLRVPGAIDPFEQTVRAILGQQVSVRAATTLAGRIAEKLGDPLDEERRFFPTPAQLARATLSDIAKIGMPAKRAEAVLAVAQLDEIDLEAIRGPWTQEYVKMRALRDPDAFPASDLGVIKALGGITPKEAAARAEAWRPWRSYAVLYLWTGGLS